MSLLVLIDLNAALIFLGVAAFVYRRRPPTPLWPTLFIVQLMAIVWVVGDIGTLVATDMVVEQASIGLVYGGSLGMLATWWVLGFRFAETHGLRPDWATPFVVWAPAVFAVFTWLCAATNPLHGQFLTPVIGARNEYHWLWWATVPIGYGLMVFIAAGYWWLGRKLEPASNVQKQSRIMLTATLLGLTSNAAYTLLPINWPFDLSIVGGLVTGLIFVFGIYRGTLFNLSPAALHQMLDTDPTPQLIVDREGRLLFANSSAHGLFHRVELTPNCNVEEILSRVVRRAKRSPDRLSNAERWEKINQGAFVEAFFMTAADGTKTRLWITAHPLAGIGPTLEALNIRVHDVTRVYNMEANERLMQSRLAHADRLRSLGSMAAGIAHEVNNPVGSALMAAEFATAVIETSNNPDEVKATALDALRTIVEQTKRAGRVTRSMLRFARDGSGEREVGDIGEVAVLARDFTRELATKHGAIVDFNMPADLPLVSFNGTEMEQVFVNLIHNAILSGKPGRHVAVFGEVVGDSVRVTIEDDGAGLTPDQCEQAFEPFYTSRGDTTGTGLGLSVVHGIVTDHGGEVWLDSELGLGTRACVSLPSPNRSGGS